MRKRRSRRIRLERQSVEWVERSDTHHLTYDCDGFRFALPILHRCDRETISTSLRAQRSNPCRRMKKEWLAMTASRDIPMPQQQRRTFRPAAHAHVLAVRLRD